MTILATLREAREALEFFSVDQQYGSQHKKAAQNLTAAIEQIEKAEPVVWSSEPIEYQTQTESGVVFNNVVVMPAHAIKWRLINHPAAPTVPENIASLPVKVPEGWQLVPKEPTEEMLAKGHNQIDFDRNEQNTYELEPPSQLGEEGEGTYIRQDMLDCWGAMLAAAPKEGRE